MTTEKTSASATGAKKTTGSTARSPFVKEDGTDAKATAGQETTATPGDPGPADATTEERAARLQEAVDGSGMEAAPEDQKSPTGGSFYNPATVGSGTIMPDGTYGNPLPDPNVERLAERAAETDNQ